MRNVINHNFAQGDRHAELQQLYWSTAAVVVDGLYPCLECRVIQTGQRKHDSCLLYDYAIYIYAMILNDMRSKGAKEEKKNFG